VLTAAIVAALAAAAGGAAPAGDARAAECPLPTPSAPVVARPRYASPERIHEGARVVVHYVEEGNAGPPLASSDGDTIPDYVEAAAESGDFGLAYYGASHVEDLAGVPTAMPGFFVRVCDVGGIDERPDIYIDDIGEDFGVAQPAAHAEGGPFVVISPRLAVTGGTQNFFRGDGIRFTVLHEVFHLVQYAYVPAGMPTWVAEGTANAMAIGLDTGYAHPIVFRQLDAWRRTPSRPLFDPGLNRERSYGGIGFWFAAAKHLPRYFERLGELARSGEPIGLGMQPLHEVFEEQTIVLGRPFPLALPVAFQAYGMASYLTFRGRPEVAPIRPQYTLPLRRSGRVLRNLNGMAIHFVRLTIPRRVRKISMTISATPRHAELAAMLGIRGTDSSRDAHAVGSGPIPERFSRRRSLTFRPRNDLERRNSVLVISNSHEQPVRYTLRYNVTP
jgi:hypothetical protein